MAAARPRKDADADAAATEGAAPGRVVPSASGVPTFEERLKALEQAVQDLEGEDLPLEESLRRYREGVEHLRACRDLLDDAERRLAELVAETGPGGETRAVERPLKVTDRGLAPDEEDRPPRRGRSPAGADDPA